MFDEKISHALAEPTGHATRLAPAAQDYVAIRAQTNALCQPLEIDDYGPQSMPDASPVKWHLAHTSWFFERFVLRSQVPNYRCFHPQFDLLFNSYYESVGPQQPRHARGVLTRPTVAEVYRYRDHVDQAMGALLANEPNLSLEIRHTIAVGLNHEQQHQELLLTDLKHLLFSNPLHHPYRLSEQVAWPQRPALEAHAPTGALAASGSAWAPGASLRWRRYAAGEHELGSNGGQGFCFDNEMPRHRCYTAECALAERLVSNADYREFIRADGYRRAALWLSDGWQLLQSQCWQRPLYWSEDLASEFTLAGDAALAPDAPVCHISYYEADAYARWAGARLATEAEWERAAAVEPVMGNFLDSGALHPRPPGGCEDRSMLPASAASRMRLYGDVWQWTASAYLPYPGYRPWPDALGEYNGKFMANQFVLRGGSCATPRMHIRSTYRNFFYPASRWQFSGIRLAQDV